MSFAATSQTLAPSTFAQGRNTYLQPQHFWYMFAAATALHLAAMIVWSLWPHDDVKEIPVRSLNIKLGGGGGGGNWSVVARSNPQAAQAAPPLEAVSVGSNEVKAVSNKAVAPPKQVTIADLANAKSPFNTAPKLLDVKPVPVADTKKKADEKRVNIKDQLERQRPAQNPAVLKAEAKANPKTVPAEPTSIAQAATIWQSNVKLPPAPARPEAAVSGGLALGAAPTQYVREQTIAGSGTGTGGGTGAGTGPGAGTTPNSRGGGTGAGQGAGVGDQSGIGMNSAAAREIQARYEQQISQWIEKHKIYPDEAREKGQRGEVVIRIRVDRQGNIKFTAIETPTGYEMIDRAALQMIQRANPLPAPPANYPAGNLLEFLIPTRFGN